MTVDLPFADTHIHFWDRPHPKLEWVWLESDFIHPQLGDTVLLKQMARYTTPEFLEDIAGCNVTKAVHIQAAIGSADPVDETRWIQAMAEETGWPQAIVGDAPLQNTDVEQVIEQHCEYAGMRGLRDFAQGDYLVDPAFHRGYALLEKYGLSYDLDVTWENMTKAADLARKFPGISLIVGHTGFPQDRTDEYFASWKQAMGSFSGIDNVFIKISGLGMGDYMAGSLWTIDSIRPYVETSIEIFGVARSFFGTNWPVDKMYSGYSAVVNAYRQIIAALSLSERQALLSGTAEAVYRI